MCHGYVSADKVPGPGHAGWASVVEFWSRFTLETLVEFVDVVEALAVWENGVRTYLRVEG